MTSVVLERGCSLSRTNSAVWFWKPVWTLLLPAVLCRSVLPPSHQSHRSPHHPTLPSHPHHRMGPHLSPPLEIHSMRSLNIATALFYSPASEEPRAPKALLFVQTGQDGLSRSPLAISSKTLGCYKTKAGLSKPLLYNLACRPHIISIASPFGKWTVGWARREGRREEGKKEHTNSFLRNQKGSRRTKGLCLFLALGMVVKSMGFDGARCSAQLCCFFIHVILGRAFYCSESVSSTPQKKKKDNYTYIQELLWRWTQIIQQSS